MIVYSGSEDRWVLSVNMGNPDLPRETDGGRLGKRVLVGSQGLLECS